MDGFIYETRVSPDWIDYNGHMQDAYYGLVFSHGVDRVWDAIGIDKAYRDTTGCTLYLVEDHKFFLAEVREGTPLRVETRVIDHSDKMIHLHLSMTADAKLCAVCEFMELHVNQTATPQGTPKATPMPAPVLARLQAAKIRDEGEVAALRHRSRRLQIGRG